MTSGAAPLSGCHPSPPSPVRTAMRYLVPLVLAGGSSVVRVTTAVLDTFGAARMAIVNVGLLVGTLPLPSLGRNCHSPWAGATLALFLPLAGRAVRVGQRRSGATSPVS